jgi:hypothetical protein
MVAAALVAIAAPAQAARCNQPYPPTVKLAPNATVQDMSTLRGDVTAFLAASDLYQKCLVASGATVGDMKLDSNQALKKKIGLQFNDTLRAFRATHPGL